MSKLNLFKHKSPDADDVHDEFSLDNSESDDDFRSGEFINSLNDLTEDDITPTKAPPKKSSSVLEWIRKGMFAFFSVVFLVSCFMLVQNLIDKQKGEEIYKQLEAEFFSGGFTVNAADAFRPEDGEVSYLAEDTENSSMTSMSDTIANLADSAEIGEAEQKQYNEELEMVRAKLSSLSQKNPDLYGWITVEGTNINYPLVQGEDNSYYLNHAYTGDYLPIGAIFVDYRNNRSITKNYNTVIYGHNITSGTMFHDVEKFFQDDYFNDTYIVVYTMDGIYYYEPFSIYKAKYDYQYFRTGFTSSDDFISFADEMRDNSQKEKDVEFTKNDRILTLSTCTNIINSERYALHARLVKTIVD